MAEFCSACSKAMFGKDGRDFAGLTSVSDFLKGNACVVVCEGCGTILVDPDGRCMTRDCLCQGTYGHGCFWSVSLYKDSVLQRIKDRILKIISKFFR